jgi:hypothetical protein
MQKVLKKYAESIKKAVAVSSLINVEMFTLPKVQQDKVINSGLFLCFDTYTKYRRDRTDETRIC